MREEQELQQFQQLVSEQMQRLDEIQLSAATNLGETLDING